MAVSRFCDLRSLVAKDPCPWEDGAFKTKLSYDGLGEILALRAKLVVHLNEILVPTTTTRATVLITLTSTNTS